MVGGYVIWMQVLFLGETGERTYKNIIKYVNISSSTAYTKMFLIFSSVKQP